MVCTLLHLNVYVYFEKKKYEDLKFHFQQFQEEFI